MQTGRRRVPGADVRHAGQLEQPLHRPSSPNGPWRTGKTTSTPASVAATEPPDGELWTGFVSGSDPETSS